METIEKKKNGEDFNPYKTMIDFFAFRLSDLKYDMMQM